MSATARSLLAAVAVVSEDASGATMLSDKQDKAVPCTLSPPLAEALAAARVTRAPVPASLAFGNGELRAVVICPLGNDDRRAIVLDPLAVEAELAPVIENLVNQIAHDVRNHVFSVGLQAELGARRAAAAPEVRGHFEAVLRQIDGLKLYLEKLLLFGRPLAPATVPTDLADFVREQVQHFQFSWDVGAQPASISVEYGAAVERHALDRLALDQRAFAAALREVLDNAVRSTTPAPAVTVRVDGDDAWVWVEVVDGGTGMSSETLAQVEVPMRVRRPGGAGLGIAIARKMVEAHGGRLEIASAPTGTTVRLVVPNVGTGG